MSLTDDEKLKNFTEEAVNDAKKISDEIDAKNKAELKEKIEEGEKRLLREMHDYIQTEIDRVRKENSLEISKVTITARQDYLKYNDIVIKNVFDKINVKLKSFINSPDYISYLTNSSFNFTENFGFYTDICYMPSDLGNTEIIKAALFEKYKGNDISGIVFREDTSIRAGGFKFYDKKNNIFVNDTLDEKKERAKALLTSLIGPYFKELSL